MEWVSNDYDDNNLIVTSSYFLFLSLTLFSKPQTNGRL